MIPTRSGSARVQALAFKAYEIEELADVWFFRPLGAVVARAAAALGLTPIQVTVAGGLVGMVAGALLYDESLAFAAFALLIVHSVIDSADGQLARMTGQVSELGRLLDGDGLHWLDRFERLYASAGADLPRDRVRSAFDAAEGHAASDPDIERAGFETMIERHVSWQLAHLELADRALHEHLVGGFIEPARACARANVHVLAELAGRGLRLGVVSNGCGNVDVLCADFGYAPYLSVVIDSRRAGVAKPDPAIFTLAARRLGIESSAIMMIGDSFDRDVRPAKAAGLLAAWLEGEIARECPDPSLLDLRLRRLVDLPASIAASARDVA